MTRTLAIIGYGSLFQTNQGGSPDNWSATAEVNSITLPELTRDVIDAGHEAAPNEWREVLVGIPTAGEVDIVANFIPATYQALFAEIGSGTVKSRRVVFPNGSSLVFNAYLISAAIALTVGDLITATAKFRVSGQPGPLTII
jgi:hypothetical protein